MRTIFAEYNPQRNSIDIYTNVGYMLRIDCWEAEKDLKTTPGSDCALTSLAVDEPLEYARLYLEGNLQMWGRCRRFIRVIKCKQPVCFITHRLLNQIYYN